MSVRFDREPSETRSWRKVHSQMGKRLSKKGSRSLVAIMLAVWLVLGVLGYFVGAALAPDDSRRLAAGLIGAALGSFLWVIICWITGFLLRRALVKRGYDVPGRQSDSLPG
jgi:hypothetical protein